MASSSGHEMSEDDTERLSGDKTQELTVITAHTVNDSVGKSAPDAEGAVPFKRTWSVTCIFICLCLFSFLSALDGTVITTSLPTITREIGGGDDQLYVWIAQCFIFSSTAPQLLYGQLADIFGRRDPFVVAIVLFALGSGVSGGANGPQMLIAGRTLQGLGAAGLYVLSDIIICDIVPPRYRGPYLSAVLSTAAIGSTIGPIIGGALAQRDWRWIFYLNVPISVVGLVVILLFLKVRHERSPTWLHALKQVDFLGTLVFVPSMIAIFLGLIMGGIQYPWSSWRIILPLVLGVCGWAVFHLIQASPRLCPSPSVPTRLFSNRTSAAGYLFVFLSSIALQAVAYFLPFYFQAIKLASPLLSGVYYLPFALGIIPFAGAGGAALSRWGLYVPIHYVGFALLAIGTGLFAMLDRESTRAAWIGFQFLPAAGIALLFATTLPSTLAGLPETDVAAATALFSFARSFGFVWGITMAGIVFNGQVDANLNLVSDPELRRMLSNGAAYAFAADGDRLKRLPVEQMLEVMSVYTAGLRAVWFVTMAISLLGFVCVPIERQLELKKEHSTEYGLEDKKTLKSHDAEKKLDSVTTVASTDIRT